MQSTNFSRYFYLFLLSLIWGSSFILMKKSLVVYSYDQVASLRLFITFIVLIPFVYPSLVKIKRKHIFPLLIASLFGSGIPAFLFTLAQTNLDSSFVGILNSLTPLFTFLIGSYVFKFKLFRANIIGVIIGLAGALFLTVSNFRGNVELNSYAYLVVCASIFYAISANVIKRYLYELDPIVITTFIFLCIGPISGIYVFTTNFVELYNSNDGVISFIYIVILSVLCTAIAGVIFNKLIKIASPIFATSVTYLIPVIAVFWGYLDGEDLLLKYFIGVALVFSGIYLVNKKV